MAYEFPPQGGAGVQRPAKQVRAWLRSGAPVAVLRGPVDDRSTDPSLSEGIPDEICVVARDLSPMAPVQALRERLGTRGLADRALVALLVAIRALGVPDVRNGWLPAAVLSGLRLTREFGPDVIVATGPPFTSFVAAATIAMLSGKPLVLDYRDPWAATYLPEQPPGLKRRLNPLLERWVLRRSTGVVAAHRSVFDYLRASGPVLPPDGPRRLWVPNGYDPDDFHDAVAVRGRHFVLTYTGHFYGFRDPRVLLEVLEDLLQSGAIDPERFRFRLAGDLKKVARVCNPGPALARVMQMEGYLSHPDSVRCLQESTVNLVLEGTSGGRNLHSPGKVFEVLYAARPVLLICPEGTTPALARRAGGCSINDPADRQGIRDSVLRLYEAWRAGEALAAPDRRRIRFYDRNFQAGRLLRFLRAVAPVDARERQSHPAAEAHPRVISG